MNEKVEVEVEAHLTQEGHTDEAVIGHIAEGHQWDDLSGHGVSREGLVDIHRVLHDPAKAD